jgi:hypothetical protein
MSNQSEVEEEEEEDYEEEEEEAEEEENPEYVAAVCQYTTVLKETPPGFDDNQYEVNYLKTTDNKPQQPVKKISTTTPSIATSNAKKSSFHIPTQKNTAVSAQRPCDKNSTFAPSSTLNAIGSRFQAHSSNSHPGAEGPTSQTDKGCVEYSGADSNSERLIEYCEEEDEEDENGGDAANMAVSGKLAIHLDTGETSRECCLNRLEGETIRSHTESPGGGTLEDNRPLFVKKCRGSFFENEAEKDEAVITDEGGIILTSSPPVPPPRNKNKENSMNQEQIKAINVSDSSPKPISNNSGCERAQQAPVIFDTTTTTTCSNTTSSTKGVEARLPGSFGEGKNVEYLEKEKVLGKSVLTAENNSDRSQSQSRSSSSDKNQQQHLRSNSSNNSYRRLGIVSMPPALTADQLDNQNSGKPARRISLDDLSAAFQGLNGGLRKTTPATNSSNSHMSPKPRQQQQPTCSSSHNFMDYQSDDSMLEEQHFQHQIIGDISAIKSGSQQQRRSKSEESLLDRADVQYLAGGGGSCCSSSVCSRRNSPLSHSSSAHQHLGQLQQQRSSATPPVVMAVGRSSFLRERSFVKEDSPSCSLANKSRIPIPITSSNREGADKFGGSSTGINVDHHRHTAGSNLDALGISSTSSSARPEYHPSSYATSSGRYDSAIHTSASSRYTSPYISPYTPPSSSSSHHTSTYNSIMLHDRPEHGSGSSHAYSSVAYRPTSAKEYNARYNYYSSVADPEAPPPSYLSSNSGGTVSPRWRRRSYDHDSDFVRYQRRSRPLSDYPSTTAAITANSSSPSASAAALTRSRSRSRVSEYDAYRGSGDGGYIVGTYSSRPGAGYLYGHSYYHDSSDDSGRLATSAVRHPRPPEYPPLSAEVSGRTRRYQPEK